MYDLPLNATVLEIACGTRVDGIEIAQAGMLVTALDISPQAVDKARASALGRGVGDRMRFVIADGEHLPFADRSFDACFIAASFHHFPNQRAALAEMKRVVRPGGYLVLGVEPAAWPYATLYKLLHPLKRYIRQHRHRNLDSVADDTTSGYSKRQLFDLCQEVGLQVVEIKPVKLLSEFYDSSVRMFGELMHRDLRPWQWLDRGLARCDQALERVPGLNKLFWHWNVICKLPLQ